uniref:C2 NT-type domain-containing protein n=2 Tax=Kalanchoe fedtschenkoi TaxID=63787 RepID=A0A7N0US36_KALFE
MAGRRNSNPQLLEELEELSQNLYQSHPMTNRRTASLALPRTAVPPIPVDDEAGRDGRPALLDAKPRARRMSLSPWRSRPKLDDEDDDKQVKPTTSQGQVKKLDDSAAVVDKKGFLSWKPIRALTNITKQKLSVLFSVEVVTVQGLPASMNGLRLAVCVRKKETKDGAVNTMPSRVTQGAADFEETLFVRCHVYCNTGSNKQQKFEPRPFYIYAFAVDAEELDFGRGLVDLSLMIQESVDRSHEGARIKQWDRSFNLKGKAKGGELVLKLGFQIMEKDGGPNIYSQTESSKTSKLRNFSPSFGRKQSKSSFSVPSPRMTTKAEGWSPSQPGTSQDLQGMDDLNLDEPGPEPSTSSSVQKSEEPESKIEDLDLPEFEIVDKGVEVEDKEEVKDEVKDDGDESEETSEERSVSSEVVKEMVQDPMHLTRMNELDAIAQQIKALESMMGEDHIDKPDDEPETEKLEADEETVTLEFLQMLEDEGGAEFQFDTTNNISASKSTASDDTADSETKVYLPDLGKGLGCLVQTKFGGYLAAMNPLDATMGRRDTPKLAMQLSKPLVLTSIKSIAGFEVFQKFAAIGADELGSAILSAMPIDELMGKTAEQIAFEGIASAIIHGRNKEVASSSAARTVTTVKTMATAMTSGRKERITTGIWNINEEPVTAEEILAFSLQKIEDMAIEALKIQAELTEEEAPFDVSPLKDQENPLDSAVPLEDWIKTNGFLTPEGEANSSESITLSVVVQLRDPLRQYEVVGGPLVALINAAEDAQKPVKYGEEKKYKIASLHVAGVKITTGGRKNMWDSEKQRLTAMQWLVAYGLGKAGKKVKPALVRNQELLWSISSRVVADMWLKPMRNPDVKLVKV